MSDVAAFNPREDSMKLIRDAATIVGLLEDGQLAQDLSADIAKVLAELKAQANDRPKATITGSVSIKLTFEVQGPTLEITAAVDSKTPKPPRGRSIFWVTDDGAVSTEHPRQTDMFAGPRGMKADG